MHNLTHPTIDDTMPPPVHAKPLVSVVITAYNHARYLPESIESVLQQTQKDFELILVDDGSTDDTRAMATRYPELRYVYQQNRGLSAARNAGVSHSTGEFLVFLDADDLLYPHALAVNLKYFKQHPECAFISGGHNLVTEDRKIGYVYDNKPHEEDPYLALLWDNYIGMHAAVMYRRDILLQYPYDETLRACEDYDMYLRISRNHRVFHHLERLAAYRMHDYNMSRDIPMMLHCSLKVLAKNRDHSYGPGVQKNYKQGRKNFKTHYVSQMIPRLAHRGMYPELKIGLRELRMIASSLSPSLAIRFGYRGLNKAREKFSTLIGTRIRKMNSLLVGPTGSAVPRPGRVSMGDLNRPTPFSNNFGYERGGPVDRYYIEHFLEENKAFIRGHVMEIGDNDYTMAYGGEAVVKSDILHMDASNPKATLIGDLSHADHLAPEQFDCIVLTQTLQLIYDFQAAVRQCHRLLKKGGTLLLTVPGISQIDYGQWGDTWYWSFTGKSIQKLLTESFSTTETFVSTHGNVQTATAFLYGMGKPEIDDAIMDRHDPHYQLIITARATKI